MDATTAVFAGSLKGPARQGLGMAFPPPAEFDKDIAELLSNDDVMKHLSFMTKYETGGWQESDAASRRQMQEDGFHNRTSMNGSISFNGEFAGIGGFRDVSWWNRSAEMGIILEPKFFGMGICTEVHHMCLSFAFEQLLLNRIEFKTACANKEMVGFLENVIGAVREGELREYFPQRAGSHTSGNVAVFSILLADWPTAKDKLNRRMSRL